MRRSFFIFFAGMVACPLALADAKNRTQAFYLEALGKSGLVGLGYELLFLNRFAVGTTLSAYFIDQQFISSVSPYITVYPVVAGTSRILLQTGPQIEHVSTRSKIPEWSGTSSTHFNAQLALGYEYRSRFLFRTYTMLAVGKGGAVPWLGFNFGWTL